MQITTIGLDIAKRVFQVHGADVSGKGRDARRLTRRAFRPSPELRRGATRERCSLTPRTHSARCHATLLCVLAGVLTVLAQEQSRTPRSARRRRG